VRAVTRRTALLCALAAGACQSVGTDQALAPAEAADIAALLRARIDVQRRGTGGAVGILSARDFSVVSHGVAARDSSQRVNDESVFQIASLTKIFTALLLTDAVGRGELALEEPLDAFVPVPAPRFEGRSITLLDLATHTGGLPLRPASRQDRSQDDPYAGFTEAELYADLQAVELTRAPGAAFGYSNFDYGLLGAALSNRLGRSYEQLLQSRILDPLGMRETTLTPNARMRARRVQGYDSSFEPMRPWDFGALAPAGGLFSTLRDLRKFLALWVDENDSALARAARATLAASRPGDDAETRMAIGWRVMQRGGRTVAWSNGSGGGVRSFMSFTSGRGVIAFANMATGVGMDDIGFRVLDPSYPVDVSAAPQRVAISVPAEALARYVGEYVYAPGDSMTIDRDAEGLLLLQGPNRIRLLAETPTLFFIREDTNITLEFGAAPTERVDAFTLTQGGQSYVYRRSE